MAKEGEGEASSCFSYIKHLGSGSYGTVSLVQKLTGHDMGRLYARKTEEVFGKEGRDYSTKTELDILRAARGATFLTSIVYFYLIGPMISLILPYYSGGDLKNLLKIKGPMTPKHTMFYARELVAGLGQLHSRRIIHRDFKSANVLVTYYGHIAISDFGMSRMFRKGEPEVVTQGFGTVIYRAPEILSEEPSCTYSIDWWALGCLVYELLHGNTPFFVKNSVNTKAVIFDRILNMRPNYSPKLPERMRNFIESLLDKNPDTRLGSAGGAGQVMGHDVFSDTNWTDVLTLKTQAPHVPPFTRPSEAQTTTDRKAYSKFYVEESTTERFGNLSQNLRVNKTNPSSFGCKRKCPGLDDAKEAEPNKKHKASHRTGTDSALNTDVTICSTSCQPMVDQNNTSKRKASDVTSKVAKKLKTSSFDDIITISNSKGTKHGSSNASTVPKRRKH